MKRILKVLMALTAVQTGNLHAENLDVQCLVTSDFQRYDYLTRIFVGSTFPPATNCTQNPEACAALGGGYSSTFNGENYLSKVVNYVTCDATGKFHLRVGLIRSKNHFTGVNQYVLNMSARSRIPDSLDRAWSALPIKIVDGLPSQHHLEYSMADGSLVYMECYVSYVETKDLTDEMKYKTSGTFSTLGTKDPLFISYSTGSEFLGSCSE